MSNLAKAIALAAEAFKDKTDRAGRPYILHCIRVMNAVDQNDDELMQIAILHDMIEDTNYKIPELEKMGFSYRVSVAIDRLTHYPEFSYDEYIEIVSNNHDATLVKLARITYQHYTTIP